MSAPSAWSIVLKHAPACEMIIGSPMAKPRLTNFTVDSFIAYGVATKTMNDAIDVNLRRLPR